MQERREGYGRRNVWKQGERREKDNKEGEGREEGDKGKVLNVS